LKIGTLGPSRRVGKRFQERMKKGLAALAVAAACVSCKSDYPASGGGGSRRGGDTASPETRAVRTARAAEVALGRTVVVSGTLAAHEKATLATKVAGRLQSLAVDLGSRVRRGQLIARIDPTDYQLRVQQAEAALQEARARLGLGMDDGDRVDPAGTGTVRQAAALLDQARGQRARMSKLFEEGLVPRAEFDAAEASYKVAESRHQDALEEIRGRQATAAQRRADLALARQQLQDTGVHAAFSGVVQQRRANVGEYLAAGAPLVDVVMIDPLRFRAEVPERESASVRAGQTVRISVDGAAGEYAGRIARLSPAITEGNRVLVVEADISNDGALRPGSFARAQIVTDASTTAVTVPSGAVVTFAGLEKVFLVVKGKAAERPITSGRRAEGWTEVVSGVAAGDEVVVDPGNLRAGQPVTPAAAAAAAN
jgi:RND family efflux transporter MFP subunit